MSFSNRLKSHAVFTASNGILEFKTNEFIRKKNDYMKNIQTLASTEDGLFHQFDSISFAIHIPISNGNICTIKQQISRENKCKLSFYTNSLLSFKNRCFFAIRLDTRFLYSRNSATCLGEKCTIISKDV